MMEDVYVDYVNGYFDIFGVDFEKDLVDLENLNLFILVYVIIV